VGILKCGIASSDLVNELNTAIMIDYTTIQLVHESTSGLYALNESSGEKFQSFAKWKEAAQEWADSNTNDGKVDLNTKLVGDPGRQWYQTLAIGPSRRTGRHYIVGVFNHMDFATRTGLPEDSEQGGGWHTYYSDDPEGDGDW